MDHVVLVDPDRAGTDTIRHANGRVEVGGVDSRGKTVSGEVGRLENLLLRLELGNGADGAKDLLLHDLHVLRDIGEDGRLDEVSLVAVTLAPSHNGRARLLALVNVTHDAVVLEL